MRLTSELRRLISKSVDRIGNKSLVARVFGISRPTVYKWNNRRKHTKDEKRKKKEPKITEEIELYILALRLTFEWGTERIKKGLQSLPNFMLDKLHELGVEIVQNMILSRTAINNVLKRHGLNGYKKNSKGRHFFRAKCPNELWQLDIKGPFKVEGEKYYFVIVIDDYSRYLLLAEQLDHCPDIKEIYSLINPLIEEHKPRKILTDNNPFKIEWNNLLKQEGIESLHAHPYYPQDKGKVERTIRNVAEEFIYLIKKFPEWLDGKIKEYVRWFNTERFHQGIQAIPCEIYKV